MVRRTMRGSVVGGMVGAAVSMAALLVGPVASAAQASVGFSAPASYAPGVSTAQRDFAVGDFNRDGNVDAAIAGGATGDISFLTGDGHGGFGAPVPVTSGSSYLAVASGDFNNDGKLDLVGVDRSSPDSVRVFTGDGAGGFTAQTPVTVGHRDL